VRGDRGLSFHLQSTQSVLQSTTVIQIGLPLYLP